MRSVVNDARRTTMRAPLAPATKGLNDLMRNLGTINGKHEDLVRRVDELEASLSFFCFLSSDQSSR